MVWSPSAYGYEPHTRTRWRDVIHRDITRLDSKWSVEDAEGAARDRVLWRLLSSQAAGAGMHDGVRQGKVMIPSRTRPIDHFISFTWTKKLSYQAFTMITSCMDHGNRRIRRQQYVSYSTVQTHENLFIACSSGMKVIISTRYNCMSHSKPTYSAGASVFIHFKKAFDTIHQRKC